jgi:hypothetical protein
VRGPSKKRSGDRLRGHSSMYLKLVARAIVAITAKVPQVVAILAAAAILALTAPYAASADPGTGPGVVDTTPVPAPPLQQDPSGGSGGSQGPALQGPAAPVLPAPPSAPPAPAAPPEPIVLPPSPVVVVPSPVVQQPLAPASPAAPEPLPSVVAPVPSPTVTHTETAPEVVLPPAATPALPAPSASATPGPSAGPSPAATPAPGLSSPSPTPSEGAPVPAYAPNGAPVPSGTPSPDNQSGHWPPGGNPWTPPPTSSGTPVPSSSPSSVPSTPPTTNLPPATPPPTNLPPTSLPTPPPSHPGWEDAWHHPPIDVHPQPVGDDHDGHQGGMPHGQPIPHGGDQNGPPPDSDIHVTVDGNGNTVIINNIQNTTINNTNVDFRNGDQRYYLHNYNTGQDLWFPGQYGHPLVLQPGWCGGSGGVWALSAGINVPGFSAGFSASGGVFNVNGGCGFVPPPPPPLPLVFNCGGCNGTPVTNYIVLPHDCIYYNNTTFRGTSQPGANRVVFTPQSYTPDVVQVPFINGAPPWVKVHSGKSPLPYVLALVVVVALAGGAGMAYRQGWFSRGGAHV